ncbi:MAG: hypothetical protein U0132_08005 [Gemmatimonadaceae bacterium]
MSTRRSFLRHAAGGTVLLSALPHSLQAYTVDPAATLPQGGEKFDLSWVNRLTTKHKALFDVPEVESGYGVWRASLWTNQYNQVLGVPPKDMTAVVVMRHNGIVLAMQQAFWDKYGIGKAKSVLHPITQQPTDRNPVLLSSKRKEIPDMFDAVQLDKFIARGGIALACAVAFDDCVQLVKGKDKVSDDEAKKRALASLVPGVVLQPSGVFACIRAQEAGCSYLRAS